MRYCVWTNGRLKEDDMVLMHKVFVDAHSPSEALKKGDKELGIPRDRREALRAFECPKP